MVGLGISEPSTVFQIQGQSSAPFEMAPVSHSSPGSRWIYAGNGHGSLANELLPTKNSQLKPSKIKGWKMIHVLLGQKAYSIFRGELLNFREGRTCQ